MLPSSKHPLVRQHSDSSRGQGQVTCQGVLSRQESGSSRGLPDPSASLDAIHPGPPDRSSPYASDIEHGVTSGSVSPIEPPSNQVNIVTLNLHLHTSQHDLDPNCVVSHKCDSLRLILLKHLLNGGVVHNERNTVNTVSL